LSNWDNPALLFKPRDSQCERKVSGSFKCSRKFLHREKVQDNAAREKKSLLKKTDSGGTGTGTPKKNKKKKGAEKIGDEK